MIKKLDYSMWYKYLRKEITTDFTVGFQCDCCGKVFRRKDRFNSYNLPLEFPTLKYSTLGNNLPCNFEYNFCSLDCLNSLLKEVPFSFEIIAPLYFGSMNKRDKLFFDAWEILDL